MKIVLFRAISLISVALLICLYLLTPDGFYNKKNIGSTEDCNKIPIGESKEVVLEKMGKYSYEEIKENSKIYLYFDEEWFESSDLVMVFDKNFLIEKKCR